MSYLVIISTFLVQRLRISSKRESRLGSVLKIFGLVGMVLFSHCATANWSSNFGSWTPGTTKIVDVAADSTGNAYAIGQTTAMTLNVGGVTLAKAGSTDSFVFKRNPDGSIAWVKPIGAIGATAWAYSVTVDGNGDVYATGWFSSRDLTAPTALARISTGGYQNTYIIKFSGTDGAVLWAKAFGSTGTAGAIPTRLAADGHGGLYVLGYFNGGNLTTPVLAKHGAQDAYLFKLSATDGSTTWVTSFYGGSAQTVMPQSVVVDGNDDVYVVGANGSNYMTNPSFNGMGAGAAGFVLKADKTTGAITWARRVGVSISNSYTYLMDVAVDSTTNRGYLLGSVINGSATQLTEPVIPTKGGSAGKTAFVIQIDTNNGNMKTEDASLWVQAYGSGASDGGKVNPYGIARDASGKLYVGGSFSVASLLTPALTRHGVNDSFAMRLSATDGSVEWANSVYGGSTINANVYSRTGVDGSGNVFLGGAFDTGNLTSPAINLSQSGATDALLVKYAATDGSVAASASYSGGSAGATMVVRESAFDSAGNLYIVGDFTGTTVTLGAITLNRIGTQDAVVAKLDASGTVQWANNYGGAGATVTGESIAVDASGNVYATSLYSGAGLTTPSLAKNGTKDALVLKLSATDGSILSREQVFGVTATSVQSAKIRLAGSVPVLAGAFSGGNLTNPYLTKVGTQDIYVTYLDSSFYINLNKSYGVLSGTTGLTGFAADSSGAIYLTGSFTTSLTTPALTKTGTTDGYAMKVTGCLSNLCAVAWAKSYGGTSATVNVNGLRVDGSGNVYVAGTVSGGNVSTTTPTLTKTGTKDTFAAKLDSSGAQQWAQIFGGNSATMNSPLGGLAIGNSKVFLSGDFNAALSTPALTPTGSNDAYVITLADGDGSVLASTNLGGSSTTVTSYGISAQSDGTYAAVGSFATANLTGLSLTRKGSTDGWIQRTTLGPVASDAPTGVTATAGSGQATVSWTAPANQGGAAITGYTVTASPGGGTCTTTGATTCTVTGLTNGTSYTFTVTANNGSSSPASTASSVVTPAAVVAPDAPTGVTATAGSGQATVSWTAPASQGGAAIASYTVTSNPGSFTCTATAPATTCTVSGLTNGTAYTFAVTASNGSASNASAASSPATPAAGPSAPDAPTGVTATSGNGRATVNWTAPSNNGGSAITGYTVTSTPGNLTCTTTGSTSCVVTGLTNGTSYTFTVTANNGVGTGTASSGSAALVPVTMNIYVTGSSDTTNDNTLKTLLESAGVGVTLGTAYDLMTGSENLSAYNAVYLQANYNWNTYANFTQAAATNLVNFVNAGGGLVTAEWVAWAAYTGNTPAWQQIKSILPVVYLTYGSPTSVTFTQATVNAGLNVNVATPFTFTPSDANGSFSKFAAVNGATTYYSASTSTFGTTVGMAGWPVGSNGGRVFSFAGTNGAVELGNDINLRTLLVNALKWVGEASIAVSSGTPGSPTGVTATSGNGQAIVNWIAPTNTGNPAITGYTVTSSPGNFTCTATAPATTCTVTGLSNGTPYTFTVTATNGSTGAPSSASSAVTPVVSNNANNNNAPDNTPPANPTLPTGGGTVAPTNGQTVNVTNNGGNGSTINLPTPQSNSTPGTGATVTVALPGTGNVAVSNNTAGTQLQVQSITLPGSSTPVSTVQVSTGSATLVASGAGQTLVTTGISNGLTVTSGASGTSATVTATGNTQSIALTGTANLTLGSSLDTQRTTVTLNQGSNGTNSQANLNIGGQTLSVSNSGGNTQLQVVPTVVASGQSTNTIVVTGGSANISAQSSGQVMNAIPPSTGNCATGTTGGYFEARSNNAQSNVLSVNQGNLALTGYIPQGVVAYHYTSSACNGFAMATPLDAGTAKEILIYQGEYVEVDKNGQPTKIVVRSKDGKSGAAGDPIQVPSSSGLGVDTVIPSLNQNTGRLPAGQTIAQNIESLIKLYNTSWTVSAQDTYGALRLTDSSGDKYALLPVGQVLADPERQDGVQCYGNGMCQITARNLTTSFNAALDAPQTFVAELGKIDPAAKVRLNQDGNLLLTLNNHTYLAQVSWAVAPAGAPGFASDASGITFSSTSGKQAFYPVLAKLDRLQAIVKKIDPTATALGDHQGAFAVQSQGQVYHLTPAWEIITTPAVHANDDYWLDNGDLYLNYLDGTAQGVSVQ